MTSPLDIAISELHNHGKFNEIPPETIDYGISLLFSLNALDFLPEKIGTDNKDGFAFYWLDSNDLCTCLTVHDAGRIAIMQEHTVGLSASFMDLAGPCDTNVVAYLVGTLVSGHEAMGKPFRVSVIDSSGRTKKRL